MTNDGTSRVALSVSRLEFGSSERRSFVAMASNQTDNMQSEGAKFSAELSVTDIETALPTRCNSASTRLGKEQSEDGLSKPSEDYPENLVVKKTFFELLERPDHQANFLRLRGRVRSEPAPPTIDEQHEPSTSERNKVSVTPLACADAAPATTPATALDAAMEPCGQQCTTVMMRNLPDNFTRAMLLAMVNRKGFSGRYDFLYPPVDFERGANLGAAQFWTAFDGFSGWELPTSKVCAISWGGPPRGLTAHVERYKNSPVMHHSVPDQCRPMIFAAGVRREFPPSTEKLRPPRLYF
jgi:hypothetical protein